MALAPAKPEQEKKPSKADEKKGKDKELLDAVGEMPVTADDSMGTFTEDIPEDEQFAEPDVESKNKKVGETFGDYQKEMFADMRKNPDQYLVKTSQGEMTVKEAFEKGWDPATDTFGNERKEPNKDEIFGGLPEGDRAAIDEFTDPSMHQPPDAMREGMGLDPAMGGGMPMEGEGGGLPLGGGVPGEGMPAEGGADPLAQLLGKGGGM